MGTDKIGRYEVVRELGAGAMGVVYLSHDPYMMRKVAIKVMAQEFVSDPAFVKRFWREATVIAALEHAYIVPVYDFGVEHSVPYIVMRFMPSGALDRYLTPDPLPASDVVNIVERLCHALDEAHEQNVVHRDLKPGNILLDKYGQAFLADFGLAKIAEGSQSSLGKKYIVGTPAYMSPEQALGEKVDLRSDVYAMGVIAFQLLTGRLPFDHANPMRLLMLHVDAPVLDMLTLNPQLPPAIKMAIEKALAKKPQERFETAGKFTEALTSAGRGIPSRRARKRWMKDELDKKLDSLLTDEP